MFEDLELNVWQEERLDRQTNPFRDGSNREPLVDVRIQRTLRLSAPSQMRTLYSRSKSGHKDTPMKIIESAPGAETQYALLVDWYKLTGMLPRQPINSWHRKYDHLAPRMKELRASGMTYKDIGILLNINSQSVQDYCKGHPKSAYGDKEKALAFKIFGKGISKLSKNQRKQIVELAKREDCFSAS